MILTTVYLLLHVWPYIWEAPRNLKLKPNSPFFLLNLPLPLLRADATTVTKARNTEVIFDSPPTFHHAGNDPALAF